MNQHARFQQICAGQADGVRHPISYFKANSDADVDSKQNIVGFSIVVRDKKGEVMACLSSLQHFYSLHILAECLDLWKTIEFCANLGLRNFECTRR